MFTLSLILALILALVLMAFIAGIVIVLEENPKAKWKPLFLLVLMILSVYTADYFIKGMV